MQYSTVRPCGWNCCAKSWVFFLFHLIAFDCSGFSWSFSLFYFPFFHWSVCSISDWEFLHGIVGPMAEFSQLLVWVFLLQFLCFVNLMDSSRCAEKNAVVKLDGGETRRFIAQPSYIICPDPCRTLCCWHFPSCICRSASQITCLSLPLISFSHIIVSRVRSLCVFLLSVLFSSCCASCSRFFSQGFLFLRVCLCLPFFFLLFLRGVGTCSLHYLFPFFRFYFLFFNSLFFLFIGFCNFCSSFSLSLLVLFSWLTKKTETRKAGELLPVVAVAVPFSFISLFPRLLYYRPRSSRLFHHPSSSLVRSSFHSPCYSSIRLYTNNLYPQLYSFS